METGLEPAGGMKAVPGPVVQIDEGRIQAHLDEVVRATVEETLNQLLDADADHVGGGSRIDVVDAGSGGFQHVADAGAGPGAHAQVDVIHKTHRIEPHDGRIKRTVDRDIGRTELGGQAGRSGAAGIAAPLPGAFRRGPFRIFRLLGRKPPGGQEGKPCHHDCALEKNRLPRRRRPASYSARRGTLCLFGIELAAFLGSLSEQPIVKPIRATTPF